MSRLVLVVLAAVVLPSAVWADADLDDWPCQPDVMLARVRKDGKVALKYWTYGSEARKTKSGQWVPRAVQEEMVFDPGELQLRDVGGKALDRKLLPKLLQRERPVLVMYEGPGGRIDPAFLQVIKEGVPVLVLPAPKVREPVPPAAPPGAPPSPTHGGARGH
jgi:hypothetical protein